LNNPFSNVSRRIISKHKDYAFFDKIGIIKKVDYQNASSFKPEEKNIFSSEYFLINIIEKAIKLNVLEFFISYNKDKEYSDITFNFNNNYFVIEDKYKYSKLPELPKILSFNGKEYYIKKEQVHNGSDKLFFININEFKTTETLENYDKKYVDKIFEMLTYSSGLFLLSEKNETNLYYVFLETLMQNTTKKIISLEHEVQSKVSGVFQTDNTFNKENLSLFDVLFVKTVNSKGQIDLIVEALQLGKLVVISTISQDSLLALSSLISNFNINKNLLSEKIIGVYHSTVLPKICDVCSTLFPIKESRVINEDFFSSYKMSIASNNLIRKPNYDGCSCCTNGYSSGVVVSELLQKDKDLSSEIERDFNIRRLRNLKESKRWETVYSYSRFLVEKQIVFIEDVKKII